MTPNEQALATRLELLTQRLADLEVQVRGLVTSQTVEAKEFVVRDDHGAIRARLEMAEHAPRLTFYDPSGKARLCIGLRTDGSPSIQVDQQEMVARRDECER